MSNKNKVGSEETGVTPTGDSAVKGAVGAVLLFALGVAALRSGVELGKGIADKVLRRHDKDVRILERKERRERKERLKEEKRREKERLMRERDWLYR